MAEGQGLLEAGTREVAAEIDRANARATASDWRVAPLEQELEVNREDLQKMKELVAGNESQCRGLEKRMSNMEEHLAAICDLLQKSFPSLHQLALACSIEATIPEHPDETAVASSLYVLAGAMEVIPSKHTAKVSEEIANLIHMGVCHVLACAKLAHLDIDLKEVLLKGAADATREDVMLDVANLGETAPRLSSTADAPILRQSCPL